MLRDTDALTRLIAPRLHLLFHGPIGGPPTVADGTSAAGFPCAAGELRCWAPPPRAWHVVGMCRFEPGELDEHVPGARRLPDDPIAP
ncbi:hypothetical protein [Streptomyces orinoci]|uniref:Uncharacterized protein n=1 Tax=Streptomyces orinoci TaxID=67339 RepID=A0ABV3K0K7_STRON|nr:hypothetical protein [Streptomyces orinoci]